MTKKLNWGTKIIIVYATFVVGMLLMVYKCTLQKTELVTTDYYDKELQYQTLINSASNANNMASKVRVAQEEKGIFVRMPLEAIAAKGTVEFYRPSDATKDFSASLETDKNGIQFFDRQKFVQGVYTIKVNWEKDNKQFYTEKYLYIN